MEPDYMLLDEVTSALDPELVGEVLDILRKLSDEGMTMIAVTHEIPFAREVADRIAFFHKGVIHEIGPPQELLKHPKQTRTKVDLDFHLAIADAANLPEVGKIVKVIYTRINKMLSVIFTTSKPEAVKSAINTARMVYDAIISGEPKQAARNMRHHLDTPTGALRKAVEMNIKN